MQGVYHVPAHLHLLRYTCTGRLSFANSGCEIQVLQ